MWLSLRYRLVVPLLVLLAADLAGSGLAAWVAARHADRRTAEQLTAVGRTLSEPPAFPLTERVLGQMKGLSGAEFLLVRDGRTLLSSWPLPWPEPPSGLPVAPSNGDELGPTVQMNGEQYHALRLPLRPPHPNQGSTLFIFYPAQLRRSAAWEAARLPLWLGGVAGVVAIGLAAFLAIGLVRRIRRLDQQAREIAAGRFTTVEHRSANDELGDLAASLNHMAGQLAEYREALAASERLTVLAQFAGGLAHQLRNAASGARLAVQIAQAEAEDPEPLDVALRQLNRMETMLRRFLHLGKPTEPQRQPCDLRQLLSRIVELHGPRCQHSGSRIDWQPGEEPAMIVGDAELLEQLFDNLVDNALDASGPNGLVRLSIEADKADKAVWRIEVRDNGPGPPEELADRLLEPFVTGKSLGIGLGLAVARQAVDAHQGRLRWYRQNGETVFEVELPQTAELGDGVV